MIIIANTLLPLVLSQFDAAFLKHQGAGDVKPGFSGGCKYFSGFASRSGTAQSRHLVAAKEVFLDKTRARSEYVPIQ